VFTEDVFAMDLDGLHVDATTVHGALHDDVAAGRDDIAAGRKAAAANREVATSGLPGHDQQVAAGADLAAEVLYNLLVDVAAWGDVRVAAGRDGADHDVAPGGKHDVAAGIELGASNGDVAPGEGGDAVAVDRGNAVRASAGSGAAGVAGGVDGAGGERDVATGLQRNGVAEDGAGEVVQIGVGDQGDVAAFNAAAEIPDVVGGDRGDAASRDRAAVGEVAHDVQAHLVAGHEGAVALQVAISYPHVDLGHEHALHAAVRQHHVALHQPDDVGGQQAHLRFG
jgi:hypothetical protein